LAAGDVELIVPFPAGGSLDALGRELARELGHQLKRTVIVLNVGGASGSIGAQRLLQRPPDGRTLLLGSLAHLVLGPGEPSSYRHSMAAFTPIGKVSSVDYVVVAGPKFAADSLDEWVALARSAPGRISLAHPGQRTLQFLTAREIERHARIELLHVPYSGSAPMLADISAGHVDVALIALTAARPMVEAGHAKVLGMLRADRHPLLSHWPVSGESQSLKGIYTNAWAGLFSAAGTPPPVVRQLRAALSAILRGPALRAEIMQMGGLPANPDAPADGAGFAAFVEAEMRRLAGRLEPAPSAPGQRR
jgi:tripartite-type tricarboxylate transporter receptor subunit TctC